MENKKTSVFSNSLIWFGAAISISEIATGVLLAPLGFKKGVLAILLGHLIGCLLFYLAGLIGANTGKSSMDTVKISFGKQGTIVFSFLNILQLVGWTAIMIVGGSIAANVIIDIGMWIWCITIGLLIILWILIGITNLGKINVVAVSMLFLLTLYLSISLFSNNHSATIVEGSISFGSAVELSVAMPLSWLPLISDYTRHAKSPKATTLASTSSYFIASCFMYIIGLSFAIFMGTSDIAYILKDFGLVALLIIVFSTVTTTFLDVYSAGVSSVSINKAFNEKVIAIVVTILGVFLAIFASTSKFESFLYLIGSVFAPMIAILITDYFIIKKDSSEKNVDYINLLIWIAGFILYRIFMNFNTPIGYTFPVMIIISVITILANQLDNIIKLKGEQNV
ncbi:MAG: putative hydroxymethylpyrimidine transporter CytX [Lachnospirales bacterium]